jgi:NTE family protein
MGFHPETVPEQQDPRDAQWLRDTLPIFRELDTTLLDAILEEMEWFALPGGTTLFEAGDPADALYCVLSGALGAFTKSADQSPRLVGRIFAGETVGEMALMSGNPRNATVIALRDTELARLPRIGFEKLMLRHPMGLLSLSQLIMRRFEAQQRSSQSRAIPKTFAIVPADASVSAATFAGQLATQLERIGATEWVWNRRGSTHTTAWFHEIERANEFVLYVCDAESTSWSKLCLRQADAVLIVANAKGDVAEPAVLQRNSDRFAPGRRSEVVLLHEHAIEPGRAARWLERQPNLTIHHVRNASDTARLARVLTGRATGLVLSGGGARGFAHIGVLKALREGNVAIDSIGGTSIGAVIAASYACEWPIDEITQRIHRSFVETNPLNDYTIPFIALASGRKVSRLLRREFEDRAIEDLAIAFFCVSTNLSSGQLAVHRQGSLWRWLRAAVAIPGVLPPVVAKGELFVDGATINNLPVDIMRGTGIGRVIGADVGADRVFTTDSDDSDAPPFWKVFKWFRGRKHRINILQILWRAGMVNSAANTVARRELSHVLLQPPLEQIDMLNWKSFDRAVEAGYRYTMQRLEEGALLDAMNAASKDAG